MLPILLTSSVTLGNTYPLTLIKVQNRLFIGWLFSNNLSQVLRQKVFGKGLISLMVLLLILLLNVKMSLQSSAQNWKLKLLSSAPVIEEMWTMNLFLHIWNPFPHALYIQVISSYVSWLHFVTIGLFEGLFLTWISNKNPVSWGVHSYEECRKGSGHSKLWEIL